MTSAATTYRRPLRTRVGYAIGKRYGHKKDHRLIARIGRALSTSGGWWDWGNWLMCLFGRSDGGGQYSPPEPRAWYWFEDGHKPRRWGRRTRSRLVIVKSYDAYRAHNEGVKLAREQWFIDHPVIGRKYLESIDTWVDERALLAEGDRCPEDPYWHYFNVQDDGAVLIPGSVFGGKGGVNYGLGRAPARVLVRYVVVEWWLKANWFGLRPWLYYRGLHRKVDMRRPFRCNQRPAKNSGGYSHWACELKRRHSGDHRTRSYTWNEQGRTTYEPAQKAEATDV